MISSPVKMLSSETLSWEETSNAYCQATNCAIPHGKEHRISAHGGPQTADEAFLS